MPIQNGYLLADIDQMYFQRAADSENEDASTGNASILTAYRYHHTVAILACKEHAIEKKNSACRYNPTDSLLHLSEMGCADWHDPEKTRLFHRVADHCHQNRWSHVVTKSTQNRQVNPKPSPVETARRDSRYALCQRGKKQ